MGKEADDPERDDQKNQPRWFLWPWEANEPRECRVEDDFTRQGPGDGVPEGGDRGAPPLEDERGENHSLPEFEVGACVPLVLDHAEGDEEHEEVDGVEAGEAGQPELTLDEGLRAVGVVLGEDVAGDEEEDANKDVAVVDDGVEEAEMWWGEVEEDDEDSEQGTDAC